MRVLFINTTDVSGGAAIVACRLMKGLQQYHQVESFYMVRYKRGESPATRTSISSVFEKLAERSIDKLTGFLGLQYLFFPFSSARILAYARKVKPDVISLHNTHGGYFSTPLLTRLSRIAPIAWTLHDMW
ncbi:MAG: glycosyltransferase, partial [Flavisolibacter sp.]